MRKAILLVLVLALGPASEVAKADFTFGEPTNLGPTVNSPYLDASPSLSADGLELYFDSERSGGSGFVDLWVTTRPTIDDNWEPPANLGSALNSPSYDGQPKTSANGLSLFFASNRSGSYGGRWGDLWVATRETKDDEWGTPVNLGPIVNSTYDEWSPSITADGLSLFFCSQRSGGFGGWDVWVTMRDSIVDPWGQPVNLGPTVNSSASEAYVGISANGLSIFLSEYYYPPFRAGGIGAGDLWVTTRTNNSDPWGRLMNLRSTVNTRAWDVTSDISADGSTLYFASNRPGGYGQEDLWQAPVIPIVDFNGDGTVDIKDLLRLIEAWGQDDSALDMGPTPYGDGVVDAADLEVLMGYWGREVDDPTLKACWKLDETEGDVAYDSAAENDATVMGDAIWQPDSGMVKGALQFDGIDDYVETPHILDPADGPFSVFVWIKGGAPGQAVVSQNHGVNWLKAGPKDGRLMTNLKKPRSGKALQSQAIITDDNWHRVGFVWDGTGRTLYVDDVELARDMPGKLASVTGGLYIGAGRVLEVGTFWSGMIDDVRIYDRVVEP